MNFQGDRWDAIVHQHNYPPPTDHEIDLYEQRQEERKKKRNNKEPEEIFPHQKRNRNKEMVWEQLETLYKIRMETCLTENGKNEVLDLYNERCDLLFAKCSPIKGKLASQRVFAVPRPLCGKWTQDELCT